VVNITGVRSRGANTPRRADAGPVRWAFPCSWGIRPVITPASWSHHNQAHFDCRPRAFNIQSNPSDRRASSLRTAWTRIEFRVVRVRRATLSSLRRRWIGNLTAVISRRRRRSAAESRSLCIWIPGGRTDGKEAYVSTRPPR